MIKLSKDQNLFLCDEYAFEIIAEIQVVEHKHCESNDSLQKEDIASKNRSAEDGVRTHDLRISLEEV